MRKTQYCEDVASPKIKDQTQWNVNQNLYEIVWECNTLILKFMWKSKYVKMAKKMLEKNNEEKFKLSDIKACY